MSSTNFQRLISQHPQTLSKTEKEKTVPNSHYAAKHHSAFKARQGHLKKSVNSDDHKS